MAERIVAITGVTRGLGRAMAVEFSRLGHRVAGCGRSTTEINRLSEELGPPHHFHAVDVTDAAAVQDWATSVVRDLGPPDLILNNAGIINRTAPLWEISPEEFSAVVDVNIKGVANVVRAFFPILEDTGRGVFVNFSSGWGRSTSPGVAPYCATKWAIEGLTQALAQELPSGLAAVALNPGIIDTEMLRSCFGDDAASYPEPSAWAKRAVPFLLRLGPKENGKALTAP